MSQYFLTLPHDSAEEPTMESMDPAALQAVIAEVDAFNTRLRDEGAWLFAGGLHPPSTATTVDHVGGEPVHTDGPFVEAASYVGGFWVVEAASREQAVGYAEHASRVLHSRVEVRELQERPSE